MKKRGRPPKAVVAVATTENTATTSVATSDIKAINKIRVAKRFLGTMSVDADLINDTVTIAYVPFIGNPVSVTLEHPTLAHFGDAIEKITFDSHENVKALIKKDGANLILKALTVSNMPLKDQVSNSLLDARTGAAINDEIKSVAAEKAAHEATLRATRDAIDAELASL